MAANGVQSLHLPPGHPGKPYTMSALNGEIIYIPCSKSATRLLVTGKETDDAFAILASGGSEGAPIGFHFHKEAHDVFLCLKGSVNVWADQEARTLTAGDFASVPPGTVHQYQILGTHSEFAGLIVPGGWEEFFRFIGEPYDGPLWPVEDSRNPFEVLIPKLKQAAEKFDMIPQPQYKSSEPRPFTREDKNVLPGKAEPYFLKEGSGPAYLAGGTVVRPLATTAETNGRFAIGKIEGSAKHDASLFASGQRIRFQGVHHAIQVVEGAINFTIGDDQPVKLSAEEMVYIPATTPFSFEYASRSAKAYIFSNGGGLVELLKEVGETFNSPIIPEKANKVPSLGELGNKFSYDLLQGRPRLDSLIQPQQN